MIIETVFGLAFVVQSSVAPASLDSPDLQIPSARRQTELSVTTRDAALLPLVQRATRCILRQVNARRTDDALRSDERDSLIFMAMHACDRPLRAVVTAHDRMYGPGSGEAFLRGPYLDVLPAAVDRQVRLRAQSP